MRGRLADLLIISMPPTGREEITQRRFAAARQARQRAKAAGRDAQEDLLQRPHFSSGSASERLAEIPRFENNAFVGWHWMQLTDYFLVFQSRRPARIQQTSCARIDHARA